MYTVYVYFSDAFVFVMILIKDMAFPVCSLIVVHEHLLLNPSNCPVIVALSV